MINRVKSSRTAKILVSRQSLRLFLAIVPSDARRSRAPFVLIRMIINIRYLAETILREPTDIVHRPRIREILTGSSRRGGSSLTPAPLGTPSKVHNLRMKTHVPNSVRYPFYFSETRLTPVR
ncbi:hypothetical protein EVAR_72919_1 [Eumeta japonica]|uniref:Uncharacterized protein n=1 Tax=Eumeta variegata TaxID=151549 RepID=A0A4C1SRV7_EUMVA|nr:hypothetical protein EVAR_72919_1 [Eumeta japonica]